MSSFLLMDFFFFFNYSFPSLFSPPSLHYSRSYRYNSSNPSSPFLLFFFSSSFLSHLTDTHRYFSSNPSPPFLALFLPIISYLSVTIPTTLPLPILFYKFVITSSISLSSIPSMFCLKKKCDYCPPSF